MGNNISNDLLKSLQNTVMNDSWLEGLYGKQKAEQQQALKGVFNVVADNNFTTEQKKQIETQKETIQEKVERLEAKMAVLEEELAKNADEIEKQANAITELAAEAEDKSDKMAEKQKKVVKIAIEDVFYMYEQGEIGKDAISSEIRRRISQNMSKANYQNQIEKVLGKLDAKQGEVAALVSNAQMWIDQRNVLSNQYGVTKSTYDLLNANLAQIGNTETNYTNSDYNKNVPIYSLDKTEAVSDKFENPNLNVKAGNNSNYDKNSKKPTLDSVKEKYGKYLGTKPNSSDYCSYTNDAVKNLDKALDKGLFEDLMSTGAGYNDIAKFFATNFSGAQLRFNDGKMSIPYGHGKEAQAVYTKFKNKLDSYNTSLLGAKNTWDKTGGNTIGSNKQIKALSENYSSIIDDFASKGFTFKEAMYAMFDPKKGLFKDSGVVYNCADQDKTPSYFIQFAGDQKTADFYQKLSDKIFNTWGVKHSRGVDYEEYKADGGDKSDSNADLKTQSSNRTDPLSFMQGDTQYSFIIDRNNDGAFSGKNDFVGADSNSTWLEDMKTFDTDGDGKLTGDELKNVKLLGLDYEDNASESKKNKAYTPKEVESSKSYLRAETTNIQYTLTNAADLGVEEIDLNNLEGNVNKTTGKFDINGSEKFNDGFTMKLNGKNVDVSRKDDEDYFMNAVYGDAYGKNFEVGLNETDIQKVMDKDYGEFDTFDAKYADVFSNIDVLKSADQIAQSAKLLYEDTLDTIAKDEEAELTKATNKAASFTQINNWSTLRTEVLNLASAENIAIDIEQAKGIYVLDGSLNARGIVDRYKEQMALKEDVANREEVSKQAWKAVILAAEAGISVSADEIKELLNNGQAKTAEDVIAILKENNIENATVIENNVGVINERENEIYEAFHKTFSEAGVHDKTVEALAQLCVEQQNDESFMIDKSADELANYFLKKFVFTEETKEQ